MVMIPTSDFMKFTAVSPHLGLPPVGGRLLLFFRHTTDQEAGFEPIQDLLGK